MVGVFNRALTRKVAEVLKKLGSCHLLVAHVTGGMDEISISAATLFAELIS